MRTSTAGRPGPAGLARGLLLALALCACGGEQRDGDTAPTADALASTAAAATTQADTCTGPPPTFTQTVLNGTWQALQAALADSGVTFPDVSGNADTIMVKLCRNCDSVRVAIRSANQTPCLRASDLQGSGAYRITGQFVVLDTFPKQQQWDTLYPGAVVYTFVNAKAGPATLVYNRNGTSQSAPSNAWMFWFCEDGAQNPKTPQAQWRARGNPPTPPGRVGDGDGGGSYGWMACVSGCCQFYTPPPNETSVQTTPDVANPNAPDTVGFGRNQRKPYWCHSTP